ncbi:MAG: DUF4058 family protein [Planctomycetaceae bacterium]|nr:DUF4058 family protein [Planctomycetales bacterium]MCB9922921.1 DUF4058 family protein [Planctomycetaceae bacterium]
MTKNPFPGMNPWLEARWGDIHTSLTTYARDQIQSHLPPGLRARVEEYVAVESDDVEDGDRFVPDVQVAESPFAPPAEVLSQPGVAVAEPILVARQTEPRTLRYIHIVDIDTGDRIVTSIEFLSLANKVPAPGRRQYVRKRNTLLRGAVNIVEIDLLREGEWIVGVGELRVPERCRKPYRINVIRAIKPEKSEMYPAPLTEPLPTIRIPLRPHDQDIPLQLQPLVDAAYVNGRYADEIDYRSDPKPPLDNENAAWVDAHLRELGLR